MDPVVLRRYRDARAFREAVEPFLERNEALHCLQLGLLPALAEGAWRDPFMATVVRGAEPVAVLLRTPPRPLVLSRVDDPEAVSVVAEAILRLPPRSFPDAVLAPVGPAEELVRALEEGTGRTAELVWRQGVYRARRVEPVAGVSGTPREGTPADVPTLRAWIRAFVTEAMPHQRADADALAAEWTDAPGRTLWLWEDAGAPVAMAGAGNPTANGIRISLVYTPPERRGRGYASALVSELSRAQLDAGRRHLFLFTDLANPTSNGIYTRIGYRSVGDMHQYRLGAVPRARTWGTGRR